MISNRAVCTIIAKNYISFARTLAGSFLSLHAGHKFYVLIVDDFDGYIDPENECFEIIRLSDLDIPQLPDFCFSHDLKELCTSAKARFLEFLIERESIEGLIYLDPDIMVTSSLAGVFDALNTSDVILTPHLDSGFPDDDLLPDDGSILRAGQFNLGFIAVNSSANARAFLNWWKSKLYKNCFVDLMNGYFVDQKFIDFVPLFFENVKIERSAGYNAAYWNLHSRHFSRWSDEWRCNDGPLFFFHFSGYRPEVDTISTHVPEGKVRYRISNRGDLRELFETYKNLLNQNGYRETILWPYGHGCFDSGELITPEVRRYYRKLALQRRAPGDPFSLEEFKHRVELDSNPNSELAQLNAILQSRSWRLICRYARFKDRFLVPVFDRLSPALKFKRTTIGRTGKSSRRKPAQA